MHVGCCVLQREGLLPGAAAPRPLASSVHVIGIICGCSSSFMTGSNQGGTRAARDGRPLAVARKGPWRGRGEHGGEVRGGKVRGGGRGRRARSYGTSGGVVRAALTHVGRSGGRGVKNID